MKFMKGKGNESTIRKVKSDDKLETYGVVGTVSDLLKYDFLEWCDYSPELWLFLTANSDFKDHFGKTRDEAIEEIIMKGW